MYGRSTKPEIELYVPFSTLGHAMRGIADPTLDALTHPLPIVLLPLRLWSVGPAMIGPGVQGQMES